jgi:hypothetical protein
VRPTFVPLVFGRGIDLLFCLFAQTIPSSTVLSTRKGMGETAFRSSRRRSWLAVFSVRSRHSVAVPLLDRLSPFPAYMFIRPLFSMLLTYDKHDQPLFAFHRTFPLRLAAWLIVLDYLFVRCNVFSPSFRRPTALLDSTSTTASVMTYRRSGSCTRSTTRRGIRQLCLRCASPSSLSAAWFLLILSFLQQPLRRLPSPLLLTSLRY